jgi:hypothetical protein
VTLKLNYSVGDTSPSLLFVLKDNDEEAIDLTDGYVYAKIRKDGATSNTNDGNNACTIVDEASGLARYDFTNTDLPATGKYYLQVQVLLQSGREFTNKENIEIRVKEKF